MLMVNGEGIIRLLGELTQRGESCGDEEGNEKQSNDKGIDNPSPINQSKDLPAIRE